MKQSGRATLLVASIVALLAIGQHFATAAPVQLPNIPPSVLIAVGYADTEGRGNGSGNCTYCFPSPWCGSHDVQFIGASTNYNGNPTDMSNCQDGDWDGGGMLVTNTGATPITLTNLTVVLPLPASGDPGTPSCAEPPRPFTVDIWFGQQYYFGNKSDPAYLGPPIVVPPGGRLYSRGRAATAPTRARQATTPLVLGARTTRPTTLTRATPTS